MTDYTGNPKDFTKDCDTCSCRVENLCLWGAYEKVLMGTPKRHCEYVHKPPVGGVAFFAQRKANVERTKARIFARDLRRRHLPATPIHPLEQLVLFGRPDDRV